MLQCELQLATSQGASLEGPADQLYWRMPCRANANANGQRSVPAGLSPSALTIALGGDEVEGGEAAH